MTSSACCTLATVTSWPCSRKRFCSVAAQEAREDRGHAGIAGKAAGTDAGKDAGRRDAVRLTELSTNLHPRAESVPKPAPPVISMNLPLQCNFNEKTTSTPVSIQPQTANPAIMLRISLLVLYCRVFLSLINRVSSLRRMADLPCECAEWRPVRCQPPLAPSST